MTDNPDVTREDVRWLYDKLIEDHRFYRDHRIAIKRWCITVWVAVVIAVASSRLPLGGFSSLLLMALPVVLFWFVESMYGAITIIIEQHIVLVEQMFAQPTIDREQLSKCLFVSGRERFTLIEKLKALIKSMFARETVLVLYVLLLVLSVVIVGLLVFTGLIPGSVGVSPN